MRVAIVGGGIGGCALALSLHAAGITDVTVLEASAQQGEVGVGINVLPHAVRELTELGVADSLSTRGVHTGALAYHDRFGRRIWTEPRGIAAGYRWPQWSINRAVLFDGLRAAVLDRLGHERYLAGRRVVAATDPPRLCDEFDVVVGCDGVHSAVREWMVPGEGPPLWNGVTMWRGTTAMEPFLDGRTMIMAGVLQRRMVVYPIADLDGGRQTVNWVAEVRTDDQRPMPRQEWNQAGDVGEPLAQFASFRFDWLDVPAMIAAAGTVLAYPMVDRDPLPTWRRGNATLLGDAAHPMYPVGSNGASQAIIDSRVLARALALSSSVGQALDEYEAQRLPATAAIVRANRAAGPEQCMEIVAERAPDGFDDLDSVISRTELESIVTAYRSLAGFDPAVLNERPSLDVRPDR